MGLPTSWAILSLFHWMLCRSVGLRNFALRGDDMICRMTEDQFSDYEERSRALGLSLNYRKTFISADAGVFCEEHYRVDRDQLILVPACSLRWVNPSDTERPVLTLSETCEGIARKGYSRHRLRSIACAMYPELFSSRYKAPLYVPSRFGGRGLPPPSPGSKVKPFEGEKIVYACTHGCSPPVSFSVTGPAQTLLSKHLGQVVWSTSVKDACLHYDRVVSLSRSRCVISDIAHGCVKERSLSLSEIYALLSKYFRSLPLAKGRGRSYTYIRLHRLELLPSMQSVFRLTGHICPK